jgi:hypothetical protein
VLSEVGFRNAVRDSLIAEALHHPIEQCGRVAILDGRCQSRRAFVRLDVFDKREGAADATNGFYQKDCVYQRSVVRAQAVRAVERRLNLRISYQMRDTSLRWASLSPSI